MSKFFNCNKQAGLENANEPRLGGWNPNTELGCEVKTLLHSDVRMKVGKDYIGVFRFDSEGIVEEFNYRDPHFTFLETLPWSMKRNPRVFNGKFISITRQDDGNFRPNFKPMKRGAGFSAERYAFGVYRELITALRGLVER